MKNKCDICHEEMNKEDEVTGIESLPRRQNTEESRIVIHAHKECAKKTCEQKRPPRPAKILFDD